MASTRCAPEDMNSAAVEDLKKREERAGDGSRRQPESTEAASMGGGRPEAFFQVLLRAVQIVEAVLHLKNMCNKVSGELHTRQSALGG